MSLALLGGIVSGIIYIAQVFRYVDTTWLMIALPLIVGVFLSSFTTFMGYIMFQTIEE